MGPILISINPYLWIDGLYEDEMTFRYYEQTDAGLPPHLYAIADSSFKSMVKDSKGIQTKAVDEH